MPMGIPYRFTKNINNNSTPTPLPLAKNQIHTKNIYAFFIDKPPKNIYYSNILQLKTKNLKLKILPFLPFV